MNLVKLGKKGQISIPQGVLRQLGITPESPLLVETTDDGAILLRQVSVHPIEIYSDERLSEFAREDRMTPEQAARAKPLLDDFNAWLERPAAPKPTALPKTTAPAARRSAPARKRAGAG